MEELLGIAPFIVFVCVVVGLILFFSPLIIICRLGKISVTLQEMNERSKKMEGLTSERERTEGGEPELPLTDVAHFISTRAAIKKKGGKRKWEG